MPLKAIRFIGEPTLEACLAGKATLRIGAKGEAVRRIQQALMDLDFQLLQGADGKFGPETKQALIAFQKKRTKLVDGVVGKETMAALDAAFPVGGGTGSATPAGSHWGVDTAGPASFELNDKNGVRVTLFDLVTQELGMPEFWGRYLFKGKDIAPLDDTEVNFIKSKSNGKCRILLIGNFIGQVFNVNTEAKGSEIAGSCLSRANALKVPGGVFIYADIEPDFQCQPKWFKGWFKRMQDANRGRGGLYAAPNFSRFSVPYKEAVLSDADIFGKALGSVPPDPPNIARLIWSQRPLAFFKENVNPAKFKPISYAPLEPSFHRGMTALWQYGGECVLVPGNKNSRIDMNLANRQGFASLWDLTKS